MTHSAAVQASVVVPAYNAEATLDACLSAIAAQTLPAHTFEVLVVDDGSLDATAALAARHPVRVLHQPHAGAAAARNLGAQMARGAIVVYTDADCVPAIDWLAKLIAPLQTGSHVVATRGAYRTAQRSLVARFVQVEYAERYARASQRPSIDFVDTYSAAYRRDVLLSEGGFDVAFHAATVEDHELSYRLAARGHLMLFVPGATVSHRHPATVATYARRKWRIGRDKVRVHTIHPRRIAGDSHTPLSLRIQIGLVLLLLPLAPAARHSNLARRLGLVLGCVFATTTLPLTIRAWHDDRTIALLVPPLALVRALALSSGLVAGAAVALISNRRS